ncbi:ribosome maturation factor RimM [Lichenicoccus sp.]|uniref:ribosome maturation factor RimM n=1 Tax=Lichenicoccus sp. TaxID=2781899 RepID=UPI003D125A40
MNQQRILMGVVGRPHGVRGLVHVHSYASVPEDLAGYGPLHDERGIVWTLQWQGNGIAELRDNQGRTLGDRDAAQALVNRRLYVDRERLPEPEPDEFYLADLIGLAAHERRDGIERSMGTVLAVHDYGAGASLEIGHVGHSALVPFTRLCVPQIDLAAGSLLVIPPQDVELEPSR